MLASKVQAASAHDRDHIQLLAKTFPFQGWIKKAELRGITAEQLDAIYHFAEWKCSCWHETSRHSGRCGEPLTIETLNFHNLNEWVILPATAKPVGADEDCAFAELLSMVEQPPDWYVMHSWGESLQAFRALIKEHTALRKTGNVGTSVEKPTVYWFCACARRQHRPREDDQGGTSFAKALRLAGAALIIPDIRGDEGVARAWCKCEEYEALLASGDNRPPVRLDMGTLRGGRRCHWTDGAVEAAGPGVDTGTIRIRFPRASPEGTRGQRAPRDVAALDVHLIDQAALDTQADLQSATYDWISPCMVEPPDEMTTARTLVDSLTSPDDWLQSIDLGRPTRLPSSSSGTEEVMGSSRAASEVALALGDGALFAPTLPSDGTALAPPGFPVARQQITPAVRRRKVVRAAKEDDLGDKGPSKLVGVLGGFADFAVLTFDAGWKPSKRKPAPGWLTASPGSQRVAARSAPHAAAITRDAPHIAGTAPRLQRIAAAPARGGPAARGAPGGRRSYAALGAGAATAQARRTFLPQGGAAGCRAGAAARRVGGLRDAPRGGALPPARLGASRSAPML